MIKLLLTTSLISIFTYSLISVTMAQVYHIKEMNTEEIRTLDRNKTVVLLPGGILEQHGPYLPSFTDGYVNERLTQELTEAITKKTGWQVLIFPLIPLGTGGANEIGQKYSFPGTYSIRTSTLRAIFMDLATELGSQGFKWIFVVHAHGSPNHNLALDQAGDYFHEVYAGHMVNLFGMIRDEISNIGWNLISDEQRKEDGSLSIHADMRETGQILFLKPNLVNPQYKNAPTYPVHVRKDLIRISRSENWPGYFGSPRLANREFGAKYWNEFSSRVIELALSILDGFDYTQLPRVSTDTISEQALDNERRIEKKQKEWLKAKGYEK